MQPTHEPRGEFVERLESHVIQEVQRHNRAIAGRGRMHVFLAKPWLATVSASVLLILAVGTAIVWRPADTTLYRVVEGDVREGDPPSLLRSFRLRAGATAGQVGGTGTIRSNGGGGAVLALADGSRIEMRSHSELSFERADDGVRIRLASGGIIVNAANQRTGHLYVQTKDMTVSVVGTVFVVNASEEGSRVGVIEGEVSVRQGTSAKTLLSGEQVTSNPSMNAPSVAQAIAWSRNAETLEALLQQSAVVPPDVAAQNSAAPRFEVESIRLRPATPGGGRGDSPFPSGFPPACGATLRIDPRRVLATNITVYELITLAYDKDCQFVEEHPEVAGLTGGPDWIRSARFDVEALRAEDRSDYTTRVLGGGMSEFTPGPRLRKLLQNLLARRFGLVMRHEMKEMAIYELRLANAGPRLTASKESEGGLTYMGVGLYDAIRNGISDKPAYAGLIVGSISGRRVSMTELAERLARMTARPVFDRTGVEGEFTFEFFFAPSQFRAWRRNPADTRPQLPSPSLFTVLQEELGLRLEESKQQVEFLVIERVERPTEN